MPGPITHRLDRLVPGKLYVCETGGPAIACRLAGPFDTMDQAQAAAGAIEAEHSDYQARTEIWQCPLPELDAAPTVLPAAIPGYLASAARLV